MDRRDAFEQFARPIYGTTNPHRIEAPLWDEIRIRGWSAYKLRDEFDEKVDWHAYDEHGYHSSYREAPTGPLWTWERFGRSRTELGDGRVIHIGGQHEDYYDPDFCIYNDVVVEKPDGTVEFYVYPKEEFPPTDYHTATLVGSDIIVIGALGYPDMRCPGETPVVALDTRTFEMRRLTITGDGPGWIWEHAAERIGPSSLLVVGGKVIPARDAPRQDNTALFELDLAERAWRRRSHGDTSLFPVTLEQYRLHRSPRFGTTNPELADNPFWIEMVRRQWSPSRARCHFGDLAISKDGNDTRNDDNSTANGEAGEEALPEPGDVVWSARRQEKFELALEDGRRLIVGGEVPSYGDEEKDAWVYADLIATDAVGGVSIYIYPRDIFPPLMFLGGAARGNDAYLAGFAHYTFAPELLCDFMILKLRLDDMSLTRLALPKRSERVISQSLRLEAGRLIFDLAPQAEDEAKRLVALDLATLDWAEI